MRLLLVTIGLFAACSAAPSGGYSAPAPTGPGFTHGGGVGGGVVREDCGSGLVRHVDGSCVEPVVSQNVYLYNAPDLPVSHLPPPPVPPPRVEYNVVFVRTPEGPEGLEPIVVPPPQQKTLVYVLSKAGQVAQKVIEVPAGPDQKPEVYYINYNDGDNPTLPGGVDLQSALSSASAQQGQVIEGGVGGGVGIGGGVGVVGGVGVGGGVGVATGGFAPGGATSHSAGLATQPSQSYGAP